MNETRKYIRTTGRGGETDEPRIKQEFAVEKDYSLKKMFSDLGGELFHLDSKTYRSAKALFFQPGVLTAEYFSGQQDRYTKLFKLYLIANLLFFLAGPMFGLFTQKLENLRAINSYTEALIDQEVESLEIGYEIYEERFNAHIAYKQPTYMMILVPFFALAMKVLYRKRYYFEHLIFALHFFAFFLFSAILYFGLSSGFYFMLERLGLPDLIKISEEIFVASFITIVFVFLGICTFYLAVALRIFYPGSIFKAITFSVLLWGWLILEMFGYTYFLLYNTIFSLRYFS